MARQRKKTAHVVLLDAAAAPRDGLADDLAAASWAEADQAVATLWRDLDRLEQALAKAARARVPKRAAIQLASDEALALRQSAARTARLRGMYQVGKAGETVPFDPARHEMESGEVVAGAPVRVVRPGVERRVGAGHKLVARAIVRRVSPRRAR